LGSALGYFPHNGKKFPGFSTQWKKVFHSVENSRSAAFTLMELLVVVAVIGLLAAFGLGALPAALGSAQAAACRSNLRQLAAANLAYAADHGRYVAAAADIAGKNSIRWHGVRSGKAFDGAKGPLAPYLGGGGASAWVRQCPGFRPEAEGGFEAACGGYGYNALGVGSEICLPGNGVKTEFGMRPGALARPAATVMFADAAFLKGSGTKAKLIEYSFAEPPQFAGGGTPWPSIHFRHRGKANVAWCDGHVSAEILDRTDGRSAGHALGWFGPDDNGLFDPF
jgi:prepilin-type processing-associated H-X9-DG protein/prepilin-type N-terminal cleavage/methylation domain-containing protein